jgi:hypothetical protein
MDCDKTTELQQQSVVDWNALDARGASSALDARVFLKILDATRASHSKIFLPGIRKSLPVRANHFLSLVPADMSAALLPVSARSAKQPDPRKLSPNSLNDLRNPNAITKHHQQHYVVTFGRTVDPLPSGSWTTRETAFTTDGVCTLRIECTAKGRRVTYTFTFPSSLSYKTPGYDTKKAGILGKNSSNTFFVGLQLDGGSSRDTPSYLQVRVQLDDADVAEGTFVIRPKLTTLKSSTAAAAAEQPQQRGPRFVPVEQEAFSFVLPAQENTAAESSNSNLGGLELLPFDPSLGLLEGVGDEDIISSFLASILSGSSGNF